MHWDTAAVAALFGVATGWFVPWLIAKLPEPATDVAADPETESGVETTHEDPADAEPEDEPADVTTADDPWAEKISYAVLAASPGLAWKCALATVLAAGAVGL